MESTAKWVRSFEAFDYGEKPQSMSLLEAANEAVKLSANDALHFYRVVPIDEKMTGFRVEKVSKEKEWQRASDRLRRRSARLFDHQPYSYNYR